MTAPRPAGSERALALGLAVAIERAMEPGVNASVLATARAAARILEQDTLDTLLGQFEPHLGSPWPAEMEPVRDRLLRTAARCRDEESLAPFVEAAGEWAALSFELQAIEWTRKAAPGPGIATIALPQALGDFAFDADAATLGRVRLAAPVAASLRAALDWLAGGSGFARPLELRSEDSVLEVSGAGLDPGGLDAAQRVIAAVDGWLGPNPRAGATGWTLRVPAAQAREQFLMLEQGPLRIAVPWHSVLRLQSVPAGEVESRARALGVPVLEPLAPLVTSPHERPVVTIGHGLRRGWLIADRLIWRLAAQPCAAGAATMAAGLDQSVETEDGEVFAVATARRLLGSAPIPDAVLAALASAPGVGTRVETAPAAAANEPAAESASHTPPPTLERSAVEPIAAEASHALLPWWLENSPRPDASDQAAVGEIVSAPPPPASIAPGGKQTETRNEREPAILDAGDVTPLPRASEPPAEPRAEPPAEPRAEPPAKPRAEPPAASRAPEPSKPGSDSDAEAHALSALVVDDAIASQAFLSRTLSDRGFDVVVVEGARELDAQIESRAWSLVLLDVDLPDASGAEFLKSALARLGRQEPPPPVVALVRDRHDAAEAQAAGLAEMLKKPVDEPALVRLLERLAAARKLSA